MESNIYREIVIGGQIYQASDFSGYRLGYGGSLFIIRDRKTKEFIMTRNMFHKGEAKGRPNEGDFVVIDEDEDKVWLSEEPHTAVRFLYKSLAQTLLRVEEPLAKLQQQLKEEKEGGNVNR